MPTTPNRGYPYPASTDAPRVWEDVQALAEAVDTDIDTLVPDALSTWTPTWTNLTVGTGATEAGSYVRTGRLVTASYIIIVGTGGSWSGTTSFTLPVSAWVSTLDTAIGSFVFRDVSATDWHAGTVALLSATEARCLGVWSGSLPVDALGQNGTSPVALAAGDKVSVILNYFSA